MPRNFSLEDVHVEGTERIVDAVAKYDVDRYIHVSSYNANPDSASEFYATKVFSARMTLSRGIVVNNRTRAVAKNSREASSRRQLLCGPHQCSASRTTCF